MSSCQILCKDLLALPVDISGAYPATVNRDMHVPTTFSANVSGPLHVVCQSYSDLDLGKGSVTHVFRPSRTTFHARMVLMIVAWVRRPSYQHCGSLSSALRPYALRYRSAPVLQTRLWFRALYSPWTCSRFVNYLP